jgi:hypothetical protein
MKRAANSFESGRPSIGRDSSAARHLGRTIFIRVQEFPWPCAGIGFYGRDMTLIRTTAAADDLLGQPIPDEEAAAQNAALNRVLEHLAAEGVNAQLIKRLAVECATKPGPSAETFWYPPQLILYADAGWKVATVTIGVRSGSYMVELMCVGPGNGARADRIEVVPASQPGRVAMLIGQNAGVPT